MTWSRAFDTPIALPDGRELLTLRDAGAYISALPETTQHRREWQAAAEALILVVDHNGPIMLARIGVLRALNAGMLPPATPRSKRVKSYRLIR
ncbi:hypothetical protein JQ594_15665 [Bradyrhizobium manausense]|uniref:hypothetical protein n=1 Tax=Bradyrhizobium manausense TaxID=989370 RepID=UPI001BA5E081|nr:hypothetical protein [Bradyrhizobium manausense]MBR0687369.1 hypothetical protein [Bradyrhizobium manausense]